MHIALLMTPTNDKNTLNVFFYVGVHKSNFQVQFPTHRENKPRQVVMKGYHTLE